MPAYSDYDLERYDYESAADREDRKNMAIANQIGGWGTGMTSAPPTGAPYNTPGMAIPKSYGRLEESLIGTATSPATAIPRGQSDIERAMGSMGAGRTSIPEALSSRVNEVLARLGGKLRKSTRASLTTELGSLTGALGTLQEQEYGRTVEEAKLAEGRRATALGALPTLTGVRKQALEEAVAPVELGLKGIRTGAEARRDVAAAELAGAETEKSRKETEFMGEDIGEYIKTKRALEAPYPKPEGEEEAKFEADIYKESLKQAGKLAEASALLGGTGKVDVDMAHQQAQKIVSLRRQEKEKAKALRSPENYIRYMTKYTNTKLSPQQLRDIYFRKYKNYQEEGEE